MISSLTGGAERRRDNAAKNRPSTWYTEQNKCSINQGIMPVNSQQYQDHGRDGAGRFPAQRDLAASPLAEYRTVRNAFSYAGEADGESQSIDGCRQEGRDLLCR